MRSIGPDTSGSLGMTAAGAALSAAILGLAIAPADALQGDVQRLMYVHVAAAWTGYVAFFGVLLASLGHLRTGSESTDHWARACAELGVVMTILAIMLGSLWGRLTWGAWWVWDARVTTATMLVLVYVAYLAARYIAGRDRRAIRRTAVLGVVGFAGVPLVHFSVLWWRTLHQPPTILAPNPAPPIDPVMALALVSAVLSFTLLGALAVTRRVHRLAAIEQKAAAGRAANAEAKRVVVR